MKAYEVGDFAASERLRLVERADPSPGPGEALVRVRSTGPNARDFHIMSTGLMDHSAAAENHVPLCDMAGDVVALGDGVMQVKVGDRVTMPHYRL